MVPSPAMSATKEISSGAKRGSRASPNTSDIGRDAIDSFRARKLTKGITSIATAGTPANEVSSSEDDDGSSSDDDAGGQSIRYEHHNDVMDARPHRRATRSRTPTLTPKHRFLVSADDTSETTKGRSPVVPQTPEAVLEIIVERQAFDGAWQWDGAQLVRWLGLDAVQVAAKAREVAGASVVEDKMLDITATAAVLAYLEVKLAGKKDEWEMMAEKAVAWLEEAMAAAGVAGTVDAMVAEMKGFIVL